MEAGLLILFLAVSGYAFLARRLANTFLTAPVFFLAVGGLLASLDDSLSAEVSGLLTLVAEATLVVVLFIDASRINLSDLVRHRAWPARMLLIGLPLCIVIGTLVGMFLFPHWPLFLVALIAAILSPTDAALGLPVVTNPQVPESERQALIAESGLNDGLALPVILFLATLVGFGQQESTHSWLMFGLLQIGLGPLAGMAVGWLGGRAYLYFHRHGDTEPIYEGIAILALAGMAYLLASLFDGNGFLAAFTAGLAFGALVKDHMSFPYEFSESEGQMLIWASFALVGVALLPEALSSLSWSVLGYILLSLFVIRPLAIMLSLVGSGTSLRTQLFFGWFGPRGLATALFALIVTEQLGAQSAQAVLVVAINAVWISAVLHGLTAAPLARRYGREASR